MIIRISNMVRKGELNRRFVFAYCECRKDQPFRGKQISSHREKFPNHAFSQRFRVCLGCLTPLDDATSEEEVAAFVAQHENCDVGNVASKKSRQYFAARGASIYLKSRQEHLSDSELSSGEEEDDDETKMAISNIENGVQQEPNLDEPPASQWNDWGDLEEVFGSETPRPPLAQDLPPTTTFATPQPPPTFATPQPPQPSTHTSIDPVFPVGQQQWGAVHRNELLDRVQDGRSNNKCLSEKIELLSGQLNSWKARSASLKRREEEVEIREQDIAKRVEELVRREQAAQQSEEDQAKREEEIRVRESITNSTEAVLRQAQVNLEAERRQFEADVAALTQQREIVAKQKDELHRKDDSLKKVAEKLEAARGKAAVFKAAKPTELHLPLSNAMIVADPTSEGCVIGAGNGCGHLRLKPTAEGRIEVVAYYNTAYSKRPPTNALHQPPNKRPAEEQRK